VSLRAGDAACCRALSYTDVCLPPAMFQRTTCSFRSRSPPSSAHAERRLVAMFVGVWVVGDVKASAQGGRYGELK